MRLDKLLEQKQIGSRTFVKKLLSSGKVSVDFTIEYRSNRNVDAFIQHITVQGRKIDDNSQKYIMLNKPSGVVSAVKDSKEKTVIELIDEKIDKLYPIGRLDKDTTGLLLLTNNGPLGFSMLHPKYHVEKVYQVTVNGLLSQQHIDQFKKGIIFLDGTICKPAILQLIKVSPKESKAYVTISEGKFHQIKKMFLSIGVKVIHLKRIKFGEFELDKNLKEGEYRYLKDEELQLLKKYL